MLPPIDDSVLQSNPKFAALYGIIKTNLLNPSGSTKHHPAQKERDVLAEALKGAQIRAAKTNLLRTALSRLELSSPPQATRANTSTRTTSQAKPPAKQPGSLPPELVELILILSYHLSSPTISPSTLTFLQSTDLYATLPHHLPQIGTLISSHLQSQALSISRIVSPNSNSSFLHRTIPKLPETLSTQLVEIASKKEALATRRIGLVSKTTTVLGAYHVAITLVIGILEQGKHGSVARHAKAKAEFCGLKALELQRDSLEKRARAERLVYTPEVGDALANYVKNLRDARERLGERRRKAERDLWGYGVGRAEDGGEKEKVMGEIARVYGEMIREVGEVSRDVEKLRSSR